MKLYEFDDIDRDAIRITGIVSQLLSRIKDTDFKGKYSLKSLLNTLSEKGYDIDRGEFLDMIKNPPLKNIIANVQGDRVVFKGEEQETDDNLAVDQDETSDTLEKMAKRAEKKRS